MVSAASYNPLDQLTSITPSSGSAIGMSYHGIGQAQRVSAGPRAFVNDFSVLRPTPNAAAMSG